MIGESLAIVLVILAMALMYRRAGRRDLAVLALPLVFVPVARLISAAVLGNPSLWSGNTVVYGNIIMVAGLVAAVALCTLLCGSIPNKTVRLGYLAFGFIFSGALVVAYLL